MTIRKIASSPYFYVVLCTILMISTIAYVTKAQTVSTGTLACYSQKNGALRVLVEGDSCKNNEIPIKLQTGDEPPVSSRAQVVKYEFDLYPGDIYTIPAPVIDKPMLILNSVSDVTVTLDDGSVVKSKPSSQSHSLMYESESQKWTNVLPNGIGYMWNDSFNRDGVSFKAVGTDIEVFIHIGEFADYIACDPVYPSPECQVGNLTSVHVNFEIWY